MKNKVPWTLIAVQYFEEILPLVDSLWCALQDEVYIMGCGAASGPWRHLIQAILDYTQSEKWQKTEEIENCFMLDM